MYGLRYRSKTVFVIVASLAALGLVLLYAVSHYTMDSLSTWREAVGKTRWKLEVDRERSDVDCRLIAIPHRTSNGVDAYMRLMMGPSRGNIAFHFTEMGSLILTQPFHRVVEAVERVSTPVISRDGSGWPDIATVIHCTHETPYLLYHKRYTLPEQYGGGREYGYMCVGISEEAGGKLCYDYSAKRTLYTPADTSGIMRYDAVLHDFGDLVPERPGLELLYSIELTNLDSDRNEYKLFMMAASDWKELWHVDLAGALTALVPIGEKGWICTQSHQQRKWSSSCLDASVTQLDHNGQVQIIASGDTNSDGCITRAMELPVPETVLLLQTSQKGDSVWTVAHLLNTDSLRVERSADVPASWDWLSCGSSNGQYWYYTVEDGQRLLQLDENFAVTREVSMQEPIRLLGCLPHRHGLLKSQRCSQDALLMATSSGNLVLADCKLRLLALSHLTNHLLQNQFRRPSDGQAVLPFYEDEQGPAWMLNLTDEVLNLRVSRAWNLPVWLSVLLISLPLLLLLQYILILTLRWRFFHTLSDVLFSMAPDGVVVFDDRRRLHSANQRFWRMLNTPVSQVPGLLDKRCGADALFAGTVLEELRFSLFKDQPDEGMVELVTEDGPRIWFYRVVPIRRRALGGGVILIVQDITLQLDGTKRHVWRVMSQSVAHKLKTPLQRLRLMAEGSLIFLLEKAPPQCEYVRDKQQRILDTARDIDQIIQEFFEISERVVHPQPLDLGKLVSRFSETYRDRFLREVHVDLHVRFPEELPYALVDEYHFLTLLTNLLDNALKAVQGDGRIEVELFEFVEGDHRWVRMIVRDNGIGIEKDQLPLILHQHQSFFSEGHGIGLAVVQSVIESHNGRLQVRSESGEGAEFIIDIPQAPRA